MLIHIIEKNEDFFYHILEFNYRRNVLSFISHRFSYMNVGTYIHVRQPFPWIQMYVAQCNNWVRS